MRRKSFIIIASVIVLLGLAIGGYFVFFSGDAELAPVASDLFGNLESGDIVPSQELVEGAGAGTEIAPRLIRVTDTPVALGVVAIARTSTTTTPETDTSLGNSTSTPVAVGTTETDTEVRFIDRASGNMYRYMAHERTLTRLSNKTLPGIQRASWLADGSTAYVQFLSGTGEGEYVATYVLPDSGENGFFLEQNLSVAKAIGSESLFTLLSGTTGSVGSIARSDGTGTRTLFTSLLSSFTVHPTRGSFYGATRASWLLEGYAFQINSTSGAFTRILGPLRGLSVLPSPDGSRLLYSYVDGTVLRLAVLDVATRESTALPVATLAEKCVWAPNGKSAYCGIPTSVARGLPDVWYQGAVSFTDRLWRIDMEERLATLIVDPQEVGNVSVDAVALAVDPVEDMLVFTDRSSGSLFVYDL